MTRRAFTEQEIAQIARDFATQSTVELARRLGRCVSAVKTKAARLGIVKTDDYLSEHAEARARRLNDVLPSERYNHVPIGTYRINACGHLERKMSDDQGVSSCRRWTPVYRLVWAEVHGPIPAGHLVRFRPGMATAELERITVDRLECVTRAEHIRTHSIHQYGPDIVAVTQLRAALTRHINRRLKEST